MTKPNAFWKNKKEALLCRFPGQQVPTGDANILLADKLAFGFDLPPQVFHADVAASWQVPSTVHPLNGETKELDGLEGMDWDNVQTALRGRVDRILQQQPVENDFAQYLALWRLLPEPPQENDLPELAPEIVRALRRWWRLIPADPRAPVSLLWQHQSFTSALVGTKTETGDLKPVLVQFNIADTQPFVTRARRTQDLWAGSYLLSFLCWNLLRSFVEEFGPDCVIQPLLRGQPLVDLWLREEVGVVGIPQLEEKEEEMRLMISNVPNIFTLILPEANLEENIQRACDNALKKWAEISEAVRAQFEKAAKWIDIDWQGCDAIWERQTQGFLKDNFFWAALPLPAGDLTQDNLKVWSTAHEPFLPHQAQWLNILEETRGAYSIQANGGWLYGPCSKMTALLLSDRKRVRDFQQVEEPGQKCSLTGTLQAVYPEWSSSERSQLTDARKWWETFATVPMQPFKMAGRIRRGDQLSVIPAVKRLMVQAYFEANRKKGEPRLDRHQFPSTAGIASAGFIARVLRQAQDDSKVYLAIEEYKTALAKLLGDFAYPSSQLPCWQRAMNETLPASHTLRAFTELDAECLYEEFYEPEGLKREFGEKIKETFGVNNKNLEDAKNCRKLLLDSLPPNIGRPSRYYAIIAMDGDNMGKWISGQLPGERTIGDMLPESSRNCLDSNFAALSRPLGPALHLGITSALSGFALEDARRIVEEEHTGKLVYAGGDDVLALVPVSDLMDTLDALYQAFRGVETAPGEFSGFVERDGVVEIRMGGATLSAGAVIVHEAMPLTYAMEQARAAEQDAKKRYGKDAFAIRLLKRSGSPIEVGSKWRLASINVPQAVRHAADLIQSDALSSKIGYVLENSALEATGGAWANKNDLGEARKVEFRRLATRTLASGRYLEAEVFMKEFSSIVGLPEGIQTGYANGWQAVQNLLRLARMIAEEA